MMSEEFHELFDLIEIDDESGLELPRAKSLVSAIRQHRDYTLIRLVRPVEQVDVKLEGIIADVESDGVPSHNPYGIRYRERVILWVSEDTKELVDVWALRTDFPVLIHQNQGIQGAPASLCLYFEPPLTVFRTWTPQNFLRRIQWWLEKTARGELHPVDQPVEHLFFKSRYELVLPWDLEALQAKLGQRLVVTRGDKRPDGGLTCFVEIVSADAQPRTSTVASIELTLAPIIQGFVERDPPTLGALADMLASRGTEMIELLRAALEQRIGPQGQAAHKDETFTVVVLRIPVSRALGEPAERITRRAFMILGGQLKLGMAVGAYFQHDGKYFSAAGLLDKKSSSEWRGAQIMPMEVLYRNSTKAAREQSGIQDEGPTAVLIGAGSLGSAMLNLWGRSGWGRWTVIDKDHIRPHNLARHVAYSQHIGAMKALVVSELNDAATHGASKVTAIPADAYDLSQELVRKALTEAQFVVDASTTLEYPRLISTKEEAARHVSVFITPNGSSAVLLAEDKLRNLRLRTLEAQYYRALIREHWGKSHLAGNLRTFWSGASCRDISMVLPYSEIMGHASTLAEQVRMAYRHTDAMIRIWHRDSSSGAVTVHEVEVFSESRLGFDDLDLFIDAGIEQRLRALRSAQLPNETGGVLLGYFDYNVNSIVVVDALPAPPDSKSSPGSFERGIVGLVEAVNEAANRTAGIVGYIGEWHSHPRGHSADPSTDDYIQLIHLALGMSNDGLPALQLIVGEKEMQVIQMNVGG